MSSSRRQRFRTNHSPLRTSQSLQCSLLLFVATGTERDCLRRAAREAGYAFRKRQRRLSTYYDLGVVGHETVLAVQTEMGLIMLRGLYWRRWRMRRAQMLDLDELFSPEPIDHPKLRDWRGRRKAGDTLAVEMRRPREGLVSLPPVLYVTVTSHDGKSVTEREPWEYGLDLALVEDGVRARNDESEGERFGLLLRELLRPIETRFGDGFFNGVFLELVNSSGLTQSEPLAAVLKEVSARPIHPKAAKEECTDRIRAALSQCAMWLMRSLHYERGQAEGILARAVAHYLDERFSVTRRKLLGW